ncbi:MAG: hypothetical protein AAF432_04745 [Planctomycetota bacterium]
MIRQINTLWDRLDEQPRVMQWAFWALVGMVLFVIWSYFLSPIATDWAASADRITADVEKIKNADDPTLEQFEIRQVATAIGPVAVPGPEEQGKSDLNDEIIRILQDNNASNQSVVVRDGQRMRRGTLQGVVQSKRIMRIDADVRFEASDADLTTILTQLESSPAVETISLVRIVKAGGPYMLDVSMKLEAWVIEPRKSS